jgi:L-fucose isomerase-like protein
MEELMADAVIARPAPKVGLLLNSIEVFNPGAKDASERALREYFDELISSGAIDPGSLIRGRIFGPIEASKAADEFAAAWVDLVVNANIAFPHGHVFLTLATNPYLAKIPLAVIAEPEPDMPEWGTNAWCGVIMNNHVAKQIGRDIVTIPGPYSGSAFRTEFERLLRVAGTIKFLRSDFLCRFGEAPSGFHSASGDQMAFAATFGTRIDTIDLTAVMEVYNTGKAKGYLGEVEFTRDDVAKTVDQMTAGRKVTVGPEMMEKAARLYQAYRAIVRANGYTSAAFRCWPEQNEPYIGVSACMAMGMLLTNGDVASAACESDWPTAVVQTAATLLSGKPSPCLDWVNYTGGSEIIQLGHCGMGICGLMASEGPDTDVVDVHPVIRQAGGTMGPVHLGQFAYGPKTGVCITHDPKSGFRILAFTGKSSPATNRGLRNSAVDMEVDDYKALNTLVLDGGFPHHLAVALGDITQDLRILCKYVGVEYVSPHGSA